jgi:glutaconate CoA-transferase subunit A
MLDKTTTIAEAVSLIKDGDVVAIGGHTLRRHPMALIHEIIRQGRRDLTLLGWNNGIDVDMLVGAGCVKTVVTSHVAMGSFGLARNYRREVEAGRVTVREHTETTAIDMFHAGSLGLSFFPSKTPLGTSLPTYNTNDFLPITCPFSGETYYAVRAVTPDVTIIHAHVADHSGNVQWDATYWTDMTVDPMIAKAARKVIVSVEQIVSEEHVLRHPERTVLPQVFVTAVVEAPYGAHPCCCDARYDYDHDHLALYTESANSPASFRQYLDTYIRGSADHSSYLKKIGLQHLWSITRPRIMD